MKNKIKKNENLAKCNLIINKYSYLIIIFFALLTYIQSFNFDLTNCDDIVIEANKEYFNDIKNIADALKTSYLGTGYYRPIVTISLILDAQISGTNPRGYHITNVVLHITSCIGIFILFELLGYSRTNSLFASLFYATHPLFSNAVSWILGRNDLLVGIFCIYSLIMLLHFINTKNYLYIFLHIALLFLGVLSKESALIFAFLCGIYLVFIRKDKIVSKRNIILYMSWLLIAVLWYLLRSVGTNNLPQDEFSINSFIKNLPIIPELISKLLIPFQNQVLPVYNTITTIIGVVIIIVFVFYLLNNKTKNNRILLYGIIWYLVFLFPAMFIRHANADIYFDFLDCRAYLPMLGILIIITEILSKKVLVDIKIKNYIFMLIILIILLTTNILHSRMYANPFSFWSSAIKANPEKSWNYSVLGENYRMFGDYENALLYFKKAVSMDNKNDIYINNLANIYYISNKFTEAIPSLQKILKNNPNSITTYKYLSLSYMKLNKYSDAIPILRRLHLSDTTNKQFIGMLADAWLNLNVIDSSEVYAVKLSKLGESSNLINLYMIRAGKLFENKDINQSINLTIEAIKLNPKNPKPYMNLGICYVSINEFKKADSIWRRALELEPNNINIYRNLFKLAFENMKDYNLAYTYATEIKNRGGNINNDQFDFLYRFINNKK